MPRLPLERVLQPVHVADHPADHKPRDHQHAGEQQPQQRQGNRNTAKIALRPFPEGVDAQQNAVKVVQMLPVNIPTPQP